MKINLSELSRSYSVSALTIHHLESVYRLCLGNPLYYHFCRMPLTRESIVEDMTALPPGKTGEDKYFLGFFREGRLTAVLDLILGYPDSQTAYIGFFMTEQSVQGQGVGSSIITELAEYLKGRGFLFLRLAWAKGNPQSEGFWTKQGFLPNGRQTVLQTCTVVEACRKL